MSADAGWDALVDRLAGAVEEARAPHLVIVDDAHHLLTSSRSAAALVDLRARLRARALPAHLVLSGRSPDLDDALERWAPELREAAEHRVRLEPAGPGEVGALLADWPPLDRLRAWAVFGGLPRALRHVDPDVTLATNLRRLLLSPGAPLLHAPLEALEGPLQSPARYASLLGGLARGARDWGELRERCPDFASGSQMAPYLTKLEALGLVEVRRSLDAGPGSRSRRYELTDPGLGFWFRAVAPRLARVELGDGVDAGEVAADVDAHVEAVLPRACRRWIRDRGDRLLPERARVVGGLWGAGYDLEVSGTLRNGAILYGSCAWDDEPVGPERFDSVSRQLRRTRYGFGREARHRVVFARTGFTPDALRAAARDPLVHGIEVAALVEP